MRYALLTHTVVVRLCVVARSNPCEIALDNMTNILLVRGIPTFRSCFCQCFSQLLSDVFSTCVVCCVRAFGDARLRLSVRSAREPLVVSDAHCDKRART